MAEWLCQDCKSVNASGAQNCYRCWTPRKFAEAPDAATLPPGVTVEQAHEERKRQLRPSPADARSSRRRSWIVIGFITATVAFSALSLAFVGAKGGSLGLALSLLAGEWTAFGSLLAISLVAAILAIAAMISWFVWFDRVLKNVPPLTGTWPEVSRVMAVVWWLVPVVGQLKGTFVVGHVYELFRVKGSPGLWLLGAWGVTWIGGTLAPGIAGFIVGWLPLPLDESVRLQDLISNLGQMSYIAAGFFAAALILAFEHARDRRMAGEAEAPDTTPEMNLEDRLLGRPTPTPMATSWSGAPPSWPTGPEPGQGQPPMWPGGAESWPDGPEPWPDAAEPWPPPPPTPIPTGPSRSPQPVPGGKRGGRDRGPVPFEPILVMGALVLVGVVAGVTMAGMADPFGTLGRIGGQGQPTRPSTVPWRPTAAPAASADPAASTRPETSPAPGASDAPRRTAAPRGTAAPAATAATGPTTRPTQAAVPSPALGTARPSTTAVPAPAELVARRLLRMVTPGSYRGLMEIHAALTDAAAATGGAGSITWDVRVGRTGEREYRRITTQRPDAAAEVFERAALVSSTWEREGRDDWIQRRKTQDDAATPPLFDLTDAGQLSFRSMVEEDGERLYRFAWRADDTRLRRFLGDIGVPTGMGLRSGELLTTVEGVPVRLELRFEEGGSGDATLEMTVRYSEVGSNIEVRSPRVGPPLVVRG